VEQDSEPKNPTAVENSEETPEAFSDIVSIAPEGLPATELDAEVEPRLAETSLPDTEENPADEATAAPVEGPKHSWFVVHCYSGYENKVKKGLEQRINTMGMQNLIFRAVVPTEEEIDLREGQRKVIQRRVFPGYILVEMVMTEESWYVVRNTPGVTGFVSSGDKPSPLRDDEVSKILKRMESETPKVRVTYRTGQTVRIVDGPFADFRGTVDEVNMEKGKVRVMVSMFGRETPLELDLLQVEKV
jgi:transcription termination/antitermination protein NusG